MPVTEREVRWERMFPDQLEAAFAAYPLVYFTYGLCEPHGPQNALGLDELKVHAIACRAARLYGGIVAPADFWHIHDSGGSSAWSAVAIGEVPRSWLTAEPPWMHFRRICYQLRTADSLGFHAAILLTGHYGPNWQDLNTLVRLVQPYVGTRLYALPDFEANQPGFDNDGHSGGDHAGKVETSLLWALEPQCVDLSRLPDPDEPGPHFAMGRNAYQANRRTGERMVEDEVRWLAAKGQTLMDQYERLRPAHNLRTYTAVERLWAEVVRPALPGFITMQNLWEGGQPAPDPSSVWYENWRLPEHYD
jgi:creatinine amidohydrolase